MDLSIIIPNYNCGYYLKRCLESIIDTIENISYEIIVVDNASTDSSIEMLKGLSFQIHNLNVIRNKKNYYFARANNQGSEVSSGKYILSLNCDTIVCKGMIENLVAFMEKNSEVGIVAPKVLTPNGNVQFGAHRRFPTIPIVLFTQTRLGHYFDKLFLRSIMWKKYAYLDRDFSKVEDVEEAGAICILMRRNLIEEMGMFFDEQFPLLFNDVDLSKRVSEWQLRRCVIPEATVIHYGSVSSKLLPKKVYKKEFLLGLYRYFRKHHHRLSWILFFIKPELIEIFLQKIFHPCRKGGV